MGSNNRNVSGRNDENRASWRPEDDERGSTESWGQGQSGYGAGRQRDDRSFGESNRNQQYGGRSTSPGNTDDRWSGRGGQMVDAGRHGHEDMSYGRDRTDTGYGPAQQYNQTRDQQSSGRRPVGGGYDPVMERDPHRGMDAGSHHDYSKDRGFTGGDRSTFRTFDRDRGGMDRSSAPHDRSEWNSYGAKDDHPSYGADQSMYGQGHRLGRAVHSQGQQPGQDRNLAGMHRGKGPKGYQRSDDRIREIVSEALEHDDHIDATHIEVVVKNGEVTLTGTVEDRRAKRDAEDCIAHLPGVKDVQNSLRVQGERMQNQNGSHGNGQSEATGRNETETPSIPSTPPKARA